MTRPTYPVQRQGEGRVARELAEAAYLAYSRRYGTSQSLDRIAERSGFSWAELAVFLYQQLLHERALAARDREHRDPRFDDLAEARS